MPQPFSNVYLNTARASRTGGYTGTETPNLKKVVAHIEPNMPGPSTPDGPAVTAKYYCTVDFGTDIARGDLITSITLLTDGTTPYPGLRPGPTQQMPGQPGATNLTIRVVDVRPSAPLFLPFLEIWLDYIEGGGPVHM